MFNLYKNITNPNKEQSDKTNIGYKIQNMENFLLGNNYYDYLNAMDNTVKQNSNPNLCSTISVTKQKILNINSKFKNELQYPFNILLEYASTCYRILELGDEIEKQTNKIEEVIKLIFNINKFSLLTQEI